MKVYKIFFIYIYKLLYKLFFIVILFLSPLVAFFVRFYFFRNALHEIKGRSIFCTGAAPTAKPPTKNYDKYAGISSGSGLLVNEFGCNCDICIMEESFFRKETNNLSQKKMHENCKYSKDVEQLFVVKGSSIRHEIPYNSIINYSQRFYVPKWVRAFVVNYVCKTNYLDNIGFSPYTQVGTGAWTVALLVFLGAKSIHITGINFRTGTDSEYTRYYYGIVEGVNETSYNESQIRNHASPDLQVFTSIALIYRRHLEITTDEHELESAIHPNSS